MVLATNKPKHPLVLKVVNMLQLVLTQIYIRVGPFDRLNKIVKKKEIKPEYLFHSLKSEPSVRHR